MWCQDTKIFSVALVPLESVSLANWFISQKDTKDEKKQQGQYSCDKLLPKKCLAGTTIHKAQTQMQSPHTILNLQEDPRAELWNEFPFTAIYIIPKCFWTGSKTELLERALNLISSQPPYHEQGRFPPHQVAQNSIQPGLFPRFQGLSSPMQSRRALN